MRSRYWGFKTWNIASEPIRRRVIGAMLAIAVLFAFVGAWVMWQAEMGRGSGLSKWTSRITSQTLVQMMGSNIPYLQESVQAPETEQTGFRLLFELATSINLRDPRTFLGKELPLFALFDTEIDLASNDTTFSTVPIESAPPPELEEQILKDMKKIDEKAKANTQGPKEKKVFIYHSHFSESYLPEIPGSQPNQASHGERNITMVGQHLKNTFQKLGIGSLVSKEQYPYKGAYRASRKTVQAALAKHDNLTYLIDLHRDSQRREVTTKKYQGKNYARLAFIVGKASKHYEKNLQLARHLHKEINQLYPGLSRGVFIKPQSMYSNGEYNQSLSPQSMLCEVGGVDNSFAEAYRSVEVLAKVIAERIHNATPAMEKNP